VPAADAPRWALRAAEEFVALAAGKAERVWRIADLGTEAATLRERVAAAATTADAGTDVSAHPSADPSAGVAATAGPATATATATRPALGVLGAAVSVVAPLGRVSVAQWRTLAALAAEGAGTLRVTPWRGVVVPGLGEERAASGLRELAAVGFVTRSDSPWHRVTACTGRPGCAKSLADVRADAVRALTEERGEAATADGRGDATGAPASADGEPAGNVESRGNRPLPPVHWSGCERRCGRPSGTDWLDVLATPDGYRVTLHGVTRDLPRDQAPAAVAAARRTPPTETT
jgi:precorrin-3B synthase